ncbi:hypothetical protein SDC9_195039 [bioreactor metagenome]|uniref:Protein kinase domain-containing protein n=2 Tax=root TaxID=1 RepID=A0A645I7V7_9ZZZZ
MPHIPKSMISIIERCLMVNPQDRYDNVLQIMNDLSDITENLDWHYDRRDSNYFTWSLDNGQKNIQIALYKENDSWNIINDDKIIPFIESKAKGYKEIRTIIKNYEKK